MHEAYDYWTIRAHRDSLGSVRAYLRDDLATVAENAGARLVGAWGGAGSIGWYDEEFVALVGDAPAHFNPFGGLAGIVDSGLDRLRATARPLAVAPFGREGVFAHRWFELAASDWDEFLELSTGAWPAFESAYGATIEAFLRLAEDAAATRVLLITRYPSLAAWQESRGSAREGAPSDVAEAGRRFVRRFQLTRRSIVRAGWLV
jgi:hypothetical protein